MKNTTAEFATTLPEITLSEELFDKNMMWLAMAIKTSKIDYVRECYINTLLFLQRQRIEWQKTIVADDDLLNELLLKYST